MYRGMVLHLVHYTYHTRHDIVHHDVINYDVILYDVMSLTDTMTS